MGDHLVAPRRLERARRRLGDTACVAGPPGRQQCPGEHELRIAEHDPIAGRLGHADGRARRLDRIVHHAGVHQHLGSVDLHDRHVASRVAGLGIQRRSHGETLNRPWQPPGAAMQHAEVGVCHRLRRDHPGPLGDRRRRGQVVLGRLETPELQQNETTILVHAHTVTHFAVGRERALAEVELLERLLQPTGVMEYERRLELDAPEIDAAARRGELRKHLEPLVDESALGEHDRRAERDGPLQVWPLRSCTLGQRGAAGGAGFGHETHFEAGSAHRTVGQHSSVDITGVALGSGPCEDTPGLVERGGRSTQEEPVPILEGPVIRCAVSGHMTCSHEP